MRSSMRTANGWAAVGWDDVRLAPGSAAHASLPRLRWSAQHDRRRAAFRAARDVGEKVVALCELLDDTWFGSLWRERIPDRDRMEAKDRRRARGVRLLVHLHVASLERRERR